ncbi:MAG: WD40 repeat domain-containing protein, partial [Polyangiaceae bacterium]|nr:WD40 repeat domain-containing protein [Polyangiaceae bacterium]
MIAFGSAGCCGLLCAPCSMPPSGSSPLPPFTPPGPPTPPPGPTVPGVGAVFTAEPTKTRDHGASIPLPKVSLRGTFGAPVRGSLIEESPGKTRFVINRAFNISPIGGGTLFVIHATTGIWLHETKSLTRLARIVPPPIHEMAASPDGTQIAFGAGDALGGTVELRVIGYPDLTVKTAVSDIDRPHRMRFSPAGDRVVVASYEDTVTLVDVKAGTADVYDTGQDVNDAIVMPDRPDEVAYASDEDEIVVYDMKAGRKVFGSAPLVNDYQAKGWSGFSVFVERDQMAVAFDPSAGRLLGGGDDNKVWRIDGLRSGAPRLLNPIDFNGNIREILCCGAGGSYVIALDSAAVHFMSPKGAVGPSFPPLVSSTENAEIRVAWVPDGSVLIAAEGRAMRWDPASKTALVSPDYAAAQIDAASSLDADSVFVACDGKKTCAVSRIVHASSPAPEVEAISAGNAEIASLSSLLEFSDGTRALAGSHKGNLRLVFLPFGGIIEAPIDPPGVRPGGSFEQRPGGLAHAYLEPSGRVFEIESAPRGVTLVGRTANGTDGRSLEYDNAGGRWMVRLPDGTEEPLS